MHDPSPETQPNHLAGESSPYLLQHLYNPVDWYPWGEEAFEKARREDKPVFLSIGYSACHWCHVMAHESFEEPKIAEYMNDHFVAIKVDREERPDLDQIYQTVVQVMGRSGGWPLSAFLTPDRKPFFAGTYFPATSRYGMTSFPDLLHQISRLYEEKKMEIHSDSDRLTKVLRDVLERPKATTGTPTEEVLEKALEDLTGAFDPVEGGLAGAPKFPNFPLLVFILRQVQEARVSKIIARDEVGGRQPNDPPGVLIDLVETTLDAMAAGGIYDHIGGGFARYSVDAHWLVPHFEKMLYDNAMALIAYSEAYSYFQKPRYKEVVDEIIQWSLREMYDPESGFYATLDADSDGVEGKYYAWTQQELDTLLDEGEQKVFYKAYGVTAAGNFEHHTNILHRAVDDETLGRIVGETPATIRTRLDAIKKKLLQVRDKRIHPHRDEKVLTGWNGLMVHGLFSAFSILHDEKILNVARSVLNFLQTQMLDTQARQLHTAYTNGQVKFRANLDDLAYFVQALLDDFELTHEEETLDLIQDLVEIANEEFWDDRNGGYYYASKKKDDLLARPKSGLDMPLPSPNAIMAENLLQLHYYVGKESTLSRAEKILELFKDDAQRHPSATATYFLAVQWYLYAPVEIIVIDPTLEGEIPINSENLFMGNIYIPRIHGFQGSRPRENLAMLAGRESREGNRTFYFCLRRNCLPPKTDQDEFVSILKEYYPNRIHS